MWESSGSHFFRTITGTPSGPDTFHKLRLVLTFLTNLGVRVSDLSLKRKQARRFQESSRFESLEKLLANKFASSELEDTTSLNPFTTITKLSEFHFRCRRFIPLFQIKEVISMSYARSTSSWKSLELIRHDLIFTIRDIYINFSLDTLTEFRTSSRTARFIHILL